MARYCTTCKSHRNLRSQTHCKQVDQMFITRWHLLSWHKFGIASLPPPPINEKFVVCRSFYVGATNRARGWFLKAAEREPSHHRELRHGSNGGGVQGRLWWTWNRQGRRRLLVSNVHFRVSFHVSISLSYFAQWATHHAFFFFFYPFTIKFNDIKEVPLIKCSLCVLSGKQVLVQVIIIEMINMTLLSGICC